MTRWRLAPARYVEMGGSLASVNGFHMEVVGGDWVVIQHIERTNIY